MEIGGLFVKLCIPIDPTPHTGKAFFLHRLIPVLEKLGVEVTLDKFKKVDITLGVGKFLYEPTFGKMVLRLGPAHVSTHENYKKLNKRKSKAVQRADGVIYQSQFSRQMCDKFLGKTDKPTAVIFNGCEIQSDKELYCIGDIHDINFVAGTRTWIPQKRLKYIVRAFAMAGIRNSSLFIYGKVSKKYEAENVHYRGDIKGDYIGYFQRIRRATAFINMVYLDACPNSVVEALACDCRVIHAESGGTKEIVGSSGISIRDKEWDFKPVNLLKPPKIDIHELANAMKAEAYNVFPVSNEHIDIDIIAMQYLSFFHKVLNA